MLLLLVYYCSEAKRYTIALTWALLNTSDSIQRLTLESCGLLTYCTMVWSPTNSFVISFLVSSFGLARAQRSVGHLLFWSCWQREGLHGTNELLTNLNKTNNKLTDQNPKVGLNIKWQISRWKKTDRIETHHSSLESSRTIVFWCFWLTTNNITALLTNQGQSLTIYNWLWHSVTVINSPFHDYTLLFTYWWLWHDSCKGVKRLFDDI